jgi:copper(I)-binding protein
MVTTGVIRTDRRLPAHARLRWVSQGALGFTILQLAIASAAAPVTVSGSWFRYILPQIPAGGYITLQNHSSRPAVLTGAASLACGMLMLHRTEADTMADVPSVTVPAGGTFSFSPGGYHLMCMQPKMKPGEPVPVTLTFQDGRKVSAMFPVLSANEQPDAR